MYQSGLPVRRSSKRETIFSHSARVTMRSSESPLRGMFSVRLRIHSASEASMPCFSKASVIISLRRESLVSVMKIFSGESGSASISSTFSNARTAHSIMPSSGSLVVSFCKR